MKLSETGKPVCGSCNRLATHRLAGYDRIRQATFYAYQCAQHKHSTSEPIPTMYLKAAPPRTWQCETNGCHNRCPEPGSFCDECVLWVCDPPDIRK